MKRIWMSALLLLTALFAACAQAETQVTIEYEDDRPVAVETIVVSNQHSPDVPMDKFDL